jgi:eukaryotic-like serine/threonine-protein kinase
MPEAAPPPTADPLLASLPLQDGFPRLGNTVLEASLARGATSRVYLGRHLVLNIPVVVKVLSQETCPDPHAWERFLREGAIGTKLRHPNIIKVVEYDYEGGRGYLVLEFLAGVTLGHCIFHTPLRESRALEILSPVAQGMAALWKTGYLHADIKPDNILVPVADPNPRLLDLGFVRPLDTPDPLLLANTTAGTPNYMSPEVACGALRVGIQSDMYSFGATLYHALTGELLFDGQDDKQVMEQIVSRRPVSPQALNGEISDRTSAFVLRLLEKSAECRFDSCAEFLAALGELSDSAIA